MTSSTTTRDADFEAKVVTHEGETIAELRAAMESVENKKHWKLAWEASVPAKLVGRVIRAVQFFHADTPKCTGVEARTGRVFMIGRGYLA